MKVNDTKTEYQTISISSENKATRGQEEWRNSKILGSKLCSIQDITHRIDLGCVAFRKFQIIWDQNNNLEIGTKIKLYEAMVIPILLYNSCTWSAPKNVIQKLDACQRKHLRQILKIKWPNKISNEKLYLITKAKPLS